MDWTNSSSLKRKSRKKRARFGKSTSEPNLSGHFTPRFPDNLSHLLHEYVTVDELQFYRKRRPPNIEDEFHSKESICLYDKKQPIIPFSALKSEYTKEFGKEHSPRSRSVPNKFDLNATTKELLDALRDDFIPEHPRRAKTAKISGELEIDGINGNKPSASDQQAKKTKTDSTVTEESKQDYRRKCMLKVQGELTYSPNENSGDFKGQSTMDRWESNPHLSNIQFYGKFHGNPEYRDSFKAYDKFAKSAPIKARDHLRVTPVTINTAIVPPLISPLSEYTDKFQELNLHSADRRKLFKPLSSVTMRNNLMIGHSDAHVFPEYFENYKDPVVRKPERGKPRSPVLGVSGNMEYNPEYRVKFTDFPRRRPLTQRPEAHFDFFEQRRRSPSPVQPVIITSKFNPNPHVVTAIDSIPNIPHTVVKNPFYLCQPEVRKARREILIKKRAASPSQTIAAAVRTTGNIFPTDDDEMNRRYNERSHIIKTPVKPTVHVTIENFDEPSTKPITIIGNRSPKHGRRISVQTADVNGNSYAKRNLSKIIEGNHEYTSKKKSSLTSTTSTATDDEYTLASKRLMSSQGMEGPSFVILKEPIKNNKWMKSSWYS